MRWQDKRGRTLLLRVDQVLKHFFQSHLRYFNSAHHDIVDGRFPRNQAISNILIHCDRRPPSRFRFGLVLLPKIFVVLHFAGEEVFVAC